MKVSLPLEGKKEFSYLARKDHKGCDTLLWMKSYLSNHRIATCEEKDNTGAGEAHKRRMGSQAPEAQGRYLTDQED